MVSYGRSFGARMRLGLNLAAAMMGEISRIAALFWSNGAERLLT
jgi:hypothetical protein